MIQPLVADLLPWLVAFTLADGVVQLGRGHLLLVGVGSLRPLRAGLDWLGPSPLVEAIALFDLPYLRGGGRVWFLDRRRRSEPPVLDASDLAAVDLSAAGPLAREGKAVTAGGRKLLVAPTAATAQQLLDALAPPPVDAARGRPRPVRSRSDLRAARALRLRQRPYRPALQLLGAALAAEVVAMALAVWSPLAGRVPLGAVTAAFGLLLVATAAFGTAYLRASGERWGAALAGGAAMLLPWNALHPLVHLSRPLYRRFDALTAAAALLPAPTFHALAARELVRTRLSRARTAPELAQAWDARERHIVGLLEATGSSQAAALAPPPALEGTAAYCPLCRTRYRAGFDVCKDCDVGLEPLPRAGGPATPGA